MQETARVLVVDDEADIRQILRILLENRGFCVLEAVNGAEAVETVKNQPEIDLIIMDIMMPALSGIEAVRRIRTCSAAPILFLTARTQERDRQRAFEAGGDDCLAKPFSRNELIRKVESLLRRYRVYQGKAPERPMLADLTFDLQNRRVLRADEALELTEKEYEILLFLMQHRGQTVSVEAIYDGVWHEKYMASSANTVMVHIVNLRKKLESDPADPQIIRTVWGKGYRIDG